MSRAAGDQEVAESLLELACAIEGIRGSVSRYLGLTPQQAQLLTLVAPGELTHGELANRLNCDKTNVTGLVDRLERRGLVRRHPDPDDRRVTRVGLADQGVDLVDRFRTAVSGAIAEHLMSWPSARHGELLALARATTEALRA